MGIVEEKKNLFSNFLFFMSDSCRNVENWLAITLTDSEGWDISILQDICKQGWVHHRKQADRIVFLILAFQTIIDAVMYSMFSARSLYQVQWEQTCFKDNMQLIKACNASEHWQWQTGTVQVWRQTLRVNLMQCQQLIEGANDLFWQTRTTVELGRKQRI